MTLANGVSFQVPFDAKVVFSTNIDPNELGGGDEAFLRRLPNKCLIGQIEAPAFDRILSIVSRAKGVGCGQPEADYIRSLLLNRGAKDLRPYFPADLVNLFISIAEFREMDMKLTKESIDLCMDIYFAHEGIESWVTAASQ